MPAIARKTIALVLAVLAVAAAGLGLGARSADRLANTPEPLQQILGPLATSDELRTLLPGELTTHITGTLSIPEPLHGLIESTIASRAPALLEDPDFAAAWDKTIETTRSDYVARLATAARNGTEHVSLTMDLAPLVASSYGTLRASLDGATLGLLPDTIEVPPVVIDTNWPPEDAVSAAAVNRWLAVAAGWGWLVAGAAVLLAGALLAAPRGFRAVVLAVSGAAALAGAVLYLTFGTRLLDMPVQETGLSKLFIEQLVTGVGAEVQGIGNTLVAGGIVALLAATGLWLLGRRHSAELG